LRAIGSEGVRMSEPFDVGVLVVHGIGTQTQGSTLRQWVDAVVSLFDRLASENDAPVRTKMLPEPAKGLIGMETPPVNDVKPQRWLVGEAWWADAFDAPDRTEVSQWLVDAGPWFAYFFVARLWRRFGVAKIHVVLGLLTAAAVVTIVVVTATSRSATWLASIWLGLAALLVVHIFLALKDKGPERAAASIVVLTLLVIYPLAALASAGMLVLWLVGLVPGSWTAKVRAFQMTLARTVGDSFALVSSSRRERAMFDAITQAAQSLLVELDKRAPAQRRPLVIVAHSQGAALLYRLLRLANDPLAALLADRQLTLSTHGGAILPIQVLESRRRENPTSTWWTGAASVAGFIGLLLLVVTLGQVAASGVSAWTAATAGASFLLVVWMFTTVRKDERATICRDVPPRFDGERAHERAVAPAEDAPREPGIAAEATSEGSRLPGAKAAPARSAVRSAATAAVTRATDKPPRSSAKEPVMVGPRVWDAGLVATREAVGGPGAKPPEISEFDAREVCPAVPVPPGSTLRWVDMWASCDPVPNGPLDVDLPFLGVDPYAPLPGSSSGFLPCRVANTHQPWRDHTVYVRDDEDVVVRWIGEVAYRANGTEPASFEPAAMRAEVARKARQRTGVGTLVLQAIVLALGFVAIVRRWRALDDLGRWAQRHLPSAVRSLIANLTDFVPKVVRNLFFGRSRDPAHLQGLLLAVAGVLVAAAIVTVAAYACRNAVSAAFPTSKPLPGAWYWGWVVVTAFLLVGVVAIAGWAWTRKNVDRVIPYTTVELGFAGPTSIPPRGVVTFQPLGADDSQRIAVGVGPDPAKIRLDPSRTYVVSAEAVGGKDCKSITDDHTVVVTCDLAGALIP
jgi:hypothetical protein